MTIAATLPRAQYTATSGQTVFDYTWEIFATSDLVVLQNGVALTEGSDYAVAGVSPTVGGTVTLVTGATAGDVITIYSDMPYERTTDFKTAGDFLTDALNTEFDRMIAMIKQISNAANRKIGISETDSITSLDIPDAATRASKYLGFDSTGEMVPLAATSTVLDAVTIASAIQTAVSKTTPADADLFGIGDSAASWELKQLTWANLKIALRGYETVKAGAFNIADTDMGAFIPVNGSAVVGTLQSSAQASGFFCHVLNIGTENCTISGTGGFSLSIAPNATKRIYWDGTSFQYDLIDAQPFDLSTATADVALEIGQTGFIDFTSLATIALNVACGDKQIYDVALTAYAPATGSASNSLFNPNNASYASVFSAHYIGGYSTTPSAGAPITSDFLVAPAGAYSFRGTLCTDTAAKTAEFHGVHAYDNAYNHIYECTTLWQDTTTAWTSLGTFQLSSTLASGQVSVRRIA